MATTVGKSKSAMDSLTDSFSDIVSQAKKRMSEKEFQRAEEKFDQIAKKVRASRGRRRETA
jgi:hypothetical protein